MQSSLSVLVFNAPLLSETSKLSYSFLSFYGKELLPSNVSCTTCITLEVIEVLSYSSRNGSLSWLFFTLATSPTFHPELVFANQIVMKGLHSFQAAFEYFLKEKQRSDMPGVSLALSVFLALSRTGAQTLQCNGCKGVIDVFTSINVHQIVFLHPVKDFFVTCIS